MHPILAARTRLLLYLAAWAVGGALLAAALRLVQPRPWAEALLFAVPLALAFAFLCLSAWPVCRATPLGKSRPARLLATHAAAAVATSALWIGAAGAWAGAISALGPFGNVLDRFPGDASVLFFAGVLLSVVSSIVHYLWIALEASRDAERIALELQVLAREAELGALRAQIHPHFLFNSLNSIAALAGSDPGEARRACVLLADFLRSGMRVGRRDRIPLSEEVALAENYLAVERVRFGARLEVLAQIDPAAAACLVPPLLLQPLVENAVGHGVAGCAQGGAVRIEARRDGPRLEIRIDNPCDADRPPRAGGGTGLANVRARLRALHPWDADLAVHGEPGRFRVVLSLPAVEPARPASPAPERSAGVADAD